MTMLSKGVSWPSNTAFTSDHVGSYVVTVISHPEACVVASRTFTIELYECLADQIEIDQFDSLFKDS